MTLAGLGVLACAAQPPPEPKGAVSELRSCVVRRDAAAAHDLLTAEGRRVLSLERTARLLQSKDGELLARLTAASAAGASTKVTIHYETNPTVTLVKQDDTNWRIDSAGLLPPASTTVTDALTSLRLALVRLRSDTLWSLMTPQLRRQWDADISGLVEGLRHPEALDVVRRGNRAIVKLPTARTLQFTLEAGTWQLDTVE